MAEQDSELDGLSPAALRWLRALGALLAMGLLIVAIWFGEGYTRLSAECDEAEAAQIGTIPVDFSKPGQYEIEVTNRSRLAHGVAHILKVDRAVDEGNSVRKLLSGLAASIELGDMDGTPGRGRPIDLERVDAHGDEIRLDGFGGGPHEYRLRVEITQGAPALAGMKQLLFARNMMCCTPGTVKVIGILACLAGLGAAGILALVWRSLRRSRRQAKLSSQCGE